MGILDFIMSNPHFALVYPGWGIVGLNIDRCINATELVSIAFLWLLLPPEVNVKRHGLNKLCWL